MFFNGLLEYLTPQQLIDFQNFKKFLIDNNVISTTVGVLIAYSAWNFIQSFVGDLTLPAIYYLFVGSFIKNEFVSSIFEPVKKLNLPKFFTELLSFLLIIIFTYLSIQYIIKNWMTTSTTINQNTTPTPQVIQGNTVAQVISQENTNFKAFNDFTRLGSHST